MVFDFDPDKDAINRAKHGVSLAFGSRVFADRQMIALASFRQIDGEDRYKAVGLIEGKLWTAVFVERSEVTRLISVRRSNAGEQGKYDRYSRGS